MTLSQLAARSTRGLSFMLAGIGAHFLAQAWEALLSEGSPLAVAPLAIIVVATVLALWGAVVYLRAAFGSPKAQRETLRADEWQQRIGHVSSSSALTVVLILLAVLEILPARLLPDAETVVRIVFGTAMLSAGLALLLADRASEA